MHLVRAGGKKVAVMSREGFSRREFLRVAGGSAAIGTLLDPSASLMFSRPHDIPSPQFKWLNLGEVMPAGWIRAQLQMDITEGFAGNLDRLAPAEVATDIFGSGRNRLSRLNRPAAHGAWARTWWNGESEGNWRTGFIMMAYLSGEAEVKRKADDYVEHILRTQDPDGYIGIYNPELRYSQNPGNGELWTQACILRGLIAFYELTGERAVLDAVEGAVHCTSSHYGPGKKTAFRIPKAGGGVAHGLMYCDVLERLFDLTGKAEYRDFGVWLYEDFCAGIPRAYQDTTVASLLDTGKPFTGHGVHTYEGIRVPLWAYFVTGKPGLKKAYENAFLKIQHYTFPSGAAVSMEDIGGRKPDPTSAFYEYCAIKELLFTFSSGLQKTGTADFGDRVERIIFNAAQGARGPGGKSITYCTRDNRYQAAGELGGREKFSPTHEDVAVCCVPNATQIMSLYVRGMWMKTGQEQGLAAALYGPCTVRTRMQGIRVRIDEQTEYPFSPDVSISLSPEAPVQFPLLLRNPGWSKNTRVSCEGGSVRRRGDYFIVRKEWRQGDRVSINFGQPVTGVQACNGEIAIQRGSLVYALQIPATERIIRTYSLPGFADSEYRPSGEARWSYGIGSSRYRGASAFIAQTVETANSQFPFEAAPMQLEGYFTDSSTGELKKLSLIPMGCSTASLRRTTFPLQRQADRG